MQTLAAKADMRVLPRLDALFSQQPTFFLRETVLVCDLLNAIHCN